MPPRLRSALSAVLVALSCLLTPFGALAAWAAYGLTDSGRYVTTMAPLAADPAVRDVIADTVGTGILREVRVGRARIGGTRVDGVRMSATQGVMAPFVHDAMHSFTKTRAFRVAWDEGNRVTHDAVLRALEDEGAIRHGHRRPGPRHRQRQAPTRLREPAVGEQHPRPAHRGRGPARR